MTRPLALILSLLLAVIPAQADMSLLGVGQSAGGYAGPGDIAHSRVYTVWGLRCFRASQASLPNVLIIRRASDNTTTTIGFTAACNLDVATAGTFCAATTCFVNTWYDINSDGNTACGASGNLPCNLTQATAAQQPQLIFNCVNSTLPCIRFAGGSSQTLGGQTCTASYCGSPQQSISAVSTRTANFTTGQTIFSHGVGGSVSVRVQYPSATNSVFVIATGAAASANASDSAWHALMAYTNMNSTSNGQMCADNVCGSTAVTGGGFGSSGIIIGALGTANYLYGDVVELSYALNYTYTAAEQREICNNQYLYWGTSTAC